MTEYSIQDVAKLTGISVRSLRNYLRHYGEHLDPDRGACNALVFDDADVETFLRIRTYLREGKTRDAIRKLLSGEEPDGEIVVRRSDETPAPGVPPELLEKLGERLERQNHLLETLVDENVRLRERMEVLEVRLELRRGTAPALPDRTTPRTRRARSGSLRIPVPYFVLRMKDGAEACLRALVGSVRPRRRGDGARP